jgi:hypothetical protein
MENRCGRLSTAFAAVVLIALPVLGQTAKAPLATHKFTPPHTSWGEGDLQGWFTNENEDGTPLERPDQFAGRKLEDIQGAELAAIKADIEIQTIHRFESPLCPTGGRTISTW